MDISTCLGLLKEGAAPERTYAIGALAALGREGWEALKGVAVDNEADPVARAYAISALPRVKKLAREQRRETFELLRRMVSSDDVGVKRAALAALGELGDERAFPYLQRALGDVQRDGRAWFEEESSVREAALGAALRLTKIILARRARQVREEAGTTQKELAGMMGSSQSRIAKMEAADPLVSVDFIVKAMLVQGVRPGL